MQGALIDILLVFHVLIAVAMIGVILLQRSEGGGLGIGGGGGGGGMAGFMTGRGTANLLTRTTAILATCFIVTSIALSILSGRGSEPTSLIDQLPLSAPATEGSDTPSVPVQ